MLNRFPNVQRRATGLAIVIALLLVYSEPAIAHQQGYGFVWANDPTASSYTPSANFAYNDGGGDVLVTRSGPGVYTVTFADIDKISTTGGHVQVTAYGSASNYCKVVSWNGDTVHVACFDSSGAPTDSRFTVLYLLPDGHPNNYAYAWANSDSSSSYTPDPLYSYNAGTGSAVTAERQGTGQYTMTWDDLDLVTPETIEYVQVTAYGSGNARCATNNWFGTGARVDCFDPSGAPVDSRYTVLFLVPDVNDDGLAFAYAISPESASYSPDVSDSFNSGGGPITASRSGTGVYRMTWAGLEDVGINGGNVQVVASDLGVGETYCTVSSWTGTAANVRCFDSAGVPADSQYGVLFVKPPKKNWTQEYAFAWADQPSAATYEPSTNFAFNRAGKPIEIARSGVGDYAVIFPSFEYLPGGGNVQVSQYAGGGGHCKIDSWSSQTVHVDCFDAAGAPSDEYFTVLYLKSPPGTTSTSYAWAFDPSSASYDASGPRAFNPGGGAITGTRLGVGIYEMEFTGAGAFGVDGGHVQVTAYGGTNQRCKVAGWGTETVTVYCHDSSGARVDSQYTLLYLRPDATDDALAFAWAEDATSASYTPSSFYSFNSGDGAVTAGRLGIGSYATDFSDFGLRGVGGGHVQVTAYGSTDTRCAVGGWISETVYVECHDSAGAPADSEYDVLFIKPIAVPEPGILLTLLAGVGGLIVLAMGRRHATQV